MSKALLRVVSLKLSGKTSNRTMVCASFTSLNILRKRFIKLNHNQQSQHSLIINHLAPFSLVSRKSKIIHRAYNLKKNKKKKKNLPYKTRIKPISTKVHQVMLAKQVRLAKLKLMNLCTNQSTLKQMINQSAI